MVAWALLCADRPDPAMPVTLVIYSRDPCHLCEVAKEAVAELQRRIDFEVEVRDVDSDPEWRAAWGEQVPVGFLGDRKVFKYRVDPEALERALLSVR
jgi:glutaredoxin